MSQYVAGDHILHSPVNVLPLSLLFSLCPACLHFPALTPAPVSVAGCSAQIFPGYSPLKCCLQWLGTALGQALNEALCRTVDLSCVCVKAEGINTCLPMCTHVLASVLEVSSLQQRFLTSLNVRGPCYALGLVVYYKGFKDAVAFLGRINFP